MSDLIRQEFLSTDNDAIMKEIDHCLEYDSIATLPWGISHGSNAGTYELCDSSGSIIYILSTPEGASAINSAELASTRRIIQDAMTWVKTLKVENEKLQVKAQGQRDAISEISDVCAEWNE